MASFLGDLLEYQSVVTELSDSLLLLIRNGATTLHHLVRVKKIENSPLRFSQIRSYRIAAFACLVAANDVLNLV